MELTGPTGRGCTVWGSYKRKVAFVLRGERPASALVLAPAPAQLCACICTRALRQCYAYACQGGPFHSFVTICQGGIYRMHARARNINAAHLGIETSMRNNVDVQHDNCNRNRPGFFYASSPVRALLRNCFARRSRLVRLQTDTVTVHWLRVVTKE